MSIYSDEQLFIWDYQRLQEIKANPAPRNLLDASAILRRLLADSSEPLLRRLERTTGMKAKFKLLEESQVGFMQKLHEEFKIENSFMWCNPDPRFGPPMPTQEVGIGELLGYSIAMLNGTRITVKDFISYSANVAGGVHAGTPRAKDKALEIHQLSQLEIFGLPTALTSILSIVEIVLAGLLPIVERLRA